MVRKEYTLDDCAAFDYPAAINKVIKITKQVYKPVVLVKVSACNTVPLEHCIPLVCMLTSLS